MPRSEEIVWNIFSKFYVMRSPEIDLFGIPHVKEEFISVLKMHTISILGRFVWSTNFVQCDLPPLLPTPSFIPSPFRNSLGPVPWMLTLSLHKKCSHLSIYFPSHSKFVVFVVAILCDRLFVGTQKATNNKINVDFNVNVARL